MMHEVWAHASALNGYEPATEHLGWVQPFETDGKQIDELNPAPDSPPVAAWRAACECGWRGGQYYPRAEFPCIDDKKPHGDPPRAVQGDGTIGAESEWLDHLLQVLPEVRVHDVLTFGLRPTDVAVRTTVLWARRAGVSWSRIAAVAGVTRAEAESMWGPRHRRADGADYRPAPGQPRGRDPRPRGPER
jgi:hypothetical protein